MCQHHAANQIQTATNTAKNKVWHRQEAGTNRFGKSCGHQRILLTSPALEEFRASTVPMRMCDSLQRGYVASASRAHAIASLFLSSPSWAFTRPIVYCIQSAIS
jgi:hypothetical protein